MNKKNAIVVLLVIVLVGSLFFAPSIVARLYNTPAPISFMIYNGSLDALLSYFGGALTFMGTMSLSIIAIYQTKIIQQYNVKQDELREKPQLFVEYANALNNWSRMDISISNLSQNIAYNIKVTAYVLCQEGKSQIELKESINQETQKTLTIDYLVINGKKQLQLQNQKISKEETIIVEAEYENVSKKTYICQAKGLIQEGTGKFVFINGSTN